MPGVHVLLAEGDEDEATRIRGSLYRMEPGVRVTTAARLQRALDALDDPTLRCTITDLRLTDADGLRIVRELLARRRELPLIVVTRSGSEELAVAAMKLGAADYVRKHTGYEAQLPALVRDILGRSVVADAPALEPTPFEGSAAAYERRFVATTSAMRAVLGLIERAAHSSAPVLLEGETGTGKELLARAIHQRSPRPEAPFLVQNCAAIAESLLESELFGHVRGAFTGADRDRRGLFEEAGDGTVFLDEVADAPASVQAKLLRVLQHEEIKPVGADRVRRVRARIVAATNRPLDREISAGRFRADFYYRLAVFPIRTPPLRHRSADIAPLTQHFLRRFELREGRATGGLDLEAQRLLQMYPWPGNVRELENETHRLVLVVRPGERIRPHHLARRIRETPTAVHDEPLDRILQRVEVATIRARLQRIATKSAAAQSLGITREALYAKMRRLGLSLRE